MRPTKGGQPALKLHYFPRPYPDEVIGSLLIRACRHLGLSTKRFNREALGNRGNDFPLLMSAQLPLLVELTGVNREDLLDRHTVFPYVTAFLPADQVKQFRRRLIRTVQGGLKPLSALIQNAASPKTAWRFCPTCMSHEVQELGESYWHRTHLLPGILVCSEHDRILWQVCRTERDRLALPHDARSKPIVPPMAHEKLRLVADASVAIMRPDRRRCDSLHAVYRTLVDAAGYRISERDVAGQQVSRDLAGFYGGSFLEQVGCRYSSSPRNYWPALMIREAMVGPFAPIKHILLHTFLEQVPKVPKEIQRERPGPRSRDYDLLDTQMATSLQEAIKELARQGKRMRAWELLEKVGAWTAYRHNRLAMPKTRAIVESFRQSGQYCRRVERS